MLFVLQYPMPCSCFLLLASGALIVSQNPMGPLADVINTDVHDLNASPTNMNAMTTLLSLLRKRESNGHAALCRAEVSLDSPDNRVKVHPSDNCSWRRPR